MVLAALKCTWMPIWFHILLNLSPKSMDVMYNYGDDDNPMTFL